MKQSPNVLFMIMDDQRADAIGAAGHPILRTPTLDRLTREGTSFQRAFTTFPICEPSRAEVLTGCNSFRNEVVWFNQKIRPGLTFLPQAFQQGGYHTVHVGKWHNDGHPRDRGYSVTRRVMYHDLVGGYPQCGTHQFTFNEDGKTVSGHSTELFVEAAIQELTAAPKQRPWFMYLSLHSPHDPFDAPEPYANMYDPATVPLPANYMPEHPFDNGDMVIRDEELLPWPRTQEDVKRNLSRYYGMITHHDHHLGRVIQWLEAAGQLENTIIVFTSDHGLAVGSHGLLGKENMYDHSVGVPLILRGPGIPGGRRIGAEALAHHVDLFPTLCEMTGVELPATARDGSSLVPVINGQRAAQREAVGSGFCSPYGPKDALRDTQRMIRTGRWKLTFFPHLRRYQLFDLAADPHELRDLLADWRIDRGHCAFWKFVPPLPREEVMTAAQEMRTRLLAWQASVNDPAAASVTACPIQGV
jgi:arylsulfatase A-like enzyme